MIKIDPAKVDAIKASVDLIALAEGHTKLRKRTSKERCGPCPRCGGRDRFFVNADYWGCRGCHEKPGDAVDFVQWMDGCDFITALEKLSGETLRESDDDEGSTKRKQATRDERASVWKSALWQKNAWDIINRAADELDRDAGAPGRAYLEQRGITQHTWRCWLLGYVEYSPSTNKRHSAAISIPYLHSRTDQCFAICYRRLAPRTEQDRYLHERDSYCLLHGLHLLDLNAHTLIVVEGELNAISVWQDARELGLAVVSLGSQYVKRETLDAIAHLSARFQHCLVWCDQPDKAIKVRRAVQSRAVLPLKSPTLDGAKVDANDMLRRGLLCAFLERKVAQVQAQEHGKEAA